MEYSFQIGVCIVLFSLFLYIAYKRIKEQREDSKKFDKYLKDEYLIDPETGQKITYEQAQSGIWDELEPNSPIASEEDIEKLYTEEQKEVTRTYNYLLEKGDRIECYQELYDAFEHSKIVEKYTHFSWSPTFLMVNENIIFFIITVEQVLSTDIPYNLGSSYREQQLMCYLPMSVDLGHYYLREKTSAEKIASKIKPHKFIKSNNYQIFELRRAKNVKLVIDVFKKLDVYTDIEVEFIGYNIFIKNLKYANLKMLHKIKKLSQEIQLTM